VWRGDWLRRQRAVHRPHLFPGWCSGPIFRLNTFYMLSFWNGFYTRSKHDIFQILVNDFLLLVAWMRMTYCIVVLYIMFLIILIIFFLNIIQLELCSLQVIFFDDGKWLLNRFGFIFFYFSHLCKFTLWFFFLQNLVIVLFE
jgi:hypothetical protein